MSNTIITLEELQKIAKLSKLEFSHEELQAFQVEFESILNYIKMISECDTSEILDTHHQFDYSDTVLQEDNIGNQTLTNKKAVMNATGRQEMGYIKTSQIVSKISNE
jgi:aspartyl/glutamyl-tRNA(Asn/Gln) amidotransferase C subunit